MSIGMRSWADGLSHLFSAFFSSFLHFLFLGDGGWGREVVESQLHKIVGVPPPPAALSGYWPIAIIYRWVGWGGGGS